MSYAQPLQTVSDPLGIGILVLGIGLIGILAYVYQTRSTTDKWNVDRLDEDQEKVVDLIDDNGGNTPQKSVSEEFEWSDAKTSRISTELEELGAVDKVREDRENYLVLNKEDEAD